MKILSIAVIASVAFAGNALADDSFRIESEAQFVRDYGKQIESVAPGVYQITSGKLAGKTIAIGEAGLDYDLNTQRAIAASLPKSSDAKAKSDALIQKLQDQKARYAQLRTLATASDESEKDLSFGSIPCVYWPTNGFAIWYRGYADVFATTEFYLDRGDGTLNWYFARARATASGNVFRPNNVPISFSLFADAYANNAFTGQHVSSTSGGFNHAFAATGYVYSGPAFAHSMDAYASVQGTGNCFGHVSVSDGMRPPW